MSDDDLQGKADAVAGGYELHPLALLFPPMGDDEYAELVEDVRTNGLLEPVVLHEGKVLDGRHRAQACADAGVELRTREYGGDDPAGFVVSANIKRRHLTTSERTWIAAKLVTAERGGDQSANLQIGPRVTAADAAKRFGVGVRGVSEAKAAQSRVAPEVDAAVLEGEVTAHDAAMVSGLSHDEQRAGLRKVRASKRKTTLAREVAKPPADLGGKLPAIAVKVVCALSGEFGARDAAGARRAAVLALSERLGDAAKAGSAKAMREQAATVGVDLKIVVPKVKT